MKNKAPILILATISTVAGLAISYSTYAQVEDKRVMREGIERDKARILMKKGQGKELRNGKDV